jgi:hypothetical protein
VVEASDTLAAWTAIATNAGPTIVITNPAAPPVRFFRARSTP